jgi:hypothetical protein
MSCDGIPKRRKKFEKIYETMLGFYFVISMMMMMMMIDNTEIDVH